MRTQLLVGLDIGGTKTDAIITDLNFNIYGRATTATDTTSPAHLVANSTRVVYRALKEADATAKDVIMMGIGIPGLVVPESGEVRLAVNLKLKRYPLGSVMSAEFSCPCIVENDVRTAALGIYRFGNYGDNLAVVNIGTGISAGLILAGNLYRGTHGMAGEIGHIIMDPTAHRCNCGAKGCLETFVAGPAIARLGQEAVQKNKNTILRDYIPITTQAVYDAAKAGDPVALSIADKAGHYLGRALQSLVMSYDVESIILTGGVTRAGQTFLQPILREWKRLHHESPLAQEMLKLDMLHLAASNQIDSRVGTVALGAVVFAAQALALGGAKQVNRD